MRARLLPLSLVAFALACGGGTEASEGASGADEPAVESLHVLGGEAHAGEGPNPIVLAWEETMTNFSARADTLIVRADRTAHFERLGDGAREVDFTIEQAAWDAAVTALRSADVCVLRRTREPEHEDQMPTIVVAIETMRCRRTLTDFGWASGPARDVRAAVQALFPPTTTDPE